MFVAITFPAGKLTDNSAFTISTLSSGIPLLSNHGRRTRSQLSFGGAKSAKSSFLTFVFPLSNLFPFFLSFLVMHRILAQGVT